MPKPRAVRIELSASDRARLKTRANGNKTPHQDRLRAQVVLLAARGRPNTRTARQLGITA